MNDPEIQKHIDAYLKHFGVGGDELPLGPQFLGFKHKMGNASKKALAVLLSQNGVISIRDFERKLETSVISDKAVSDLLSLDLFSVKRR